MGDILCPWNRRESLAFPKGNREKPASPRGGALATLFACWRTDRELREHRLRLIGPDGPHSPQVRLPIRSSSAIACDRQEPQGSVEARRLIHLYVRSYLGEKAWRP